MRTFYNARKKSAEHKMLVGKPEAVKKHFGELYVDRRIIMKWIQDAVNSIMFEFQRFRRRFTRAQWIMRPGAVMGRRTEYGDIKFHVNLKYSNGFLPSPPPTTLYHTLQIIRRN